MLLSARPDSRAELLRARHLSRRPGLSDQTRSQELDALQKRVQTLRGSEGRKSEIETLRKRLASELEKAEAKGGDVRRQVTDQLIGRARKTRDRVEPVYRERVEPTVKKVVERV